MNSTVEKVKTSLEKIRKQYKELKSGGNVDTSTLSEEIKSFINALEPKDASCEELREEAEDMLVDVLFMIKEERCSPLKAKSLKKIVKSRRES